MLKEKSVSTLDYLDVANILETFEVAIEKKHSTRLNSWDICHREFVRSIGKALSDKTIEILALHLIGYLASWGMYRGSSFLLKDHSYLLHKNLIPILMQKKYIPLFNIEDIKSARQYLSLIVDVYCEIESYYANIRGKGKAISDTLVTKVMLGVYGCIPAYDTNVRNALKRCHIKHEGTIENNIRDLIDALENAQEFYKAIKAEQTRLKKKGKSYTLMKTIDTVLWAIGDK